MPADVYPSIGGVSIDLNGGLAATVATPYDLFIATTDQHALNLSLEVHPAAEGLVVAHCRNTQVERSGHVVQLRFLTRDGSSISTAQLNGRSGSYFKRGANGAFGPDDHFGPPLDRLIFAHLLADRGRAIAHAAGVVVDGKGVLLGAVSGGGKTTFANLAQSAGITVLSDERMVVGLNNDGAPTLWGTPWAGEGGQALPGPAPLTRLLFLEHAEANEAKPLRPAAALGRLLSLCTLPFWNREATKSAVDGVARAIAGLPMDTLRFVPDSTAVDYLRTLLTS
jgi:hypothetical protein